MFYGGALGRDSRNTPVVPVPCCCLQINSAADINAHNGVPQSPAALVNYTGDKL